VEGMDLFSTTKLERYNLLREEVVEEEMSLVMVYSK
jgi:hypothetical protein